jgi:hypothetical protein
MFSGSAERFADGLSTYGCEELTKTGALFSAIVLLIAAGISGAVLFTMLRQWWPAGWRADPFKSWSHVKFVALAGGAFGVITGAVLVVAVAFSTIGDGSGLPDWAYWSLPVLAWPALLALVGAGVLWLFSVIGALGSWNVVHPEQTPPGTPWEPPDDLAGIGISCSGGGIRAGSVALGALSALEEVDKTKQHTDRWWEDGLLYNSQYLASVSGGGYVAGAWRIAAGVGDQPSDPTEKWAKGIIGKPDERSATRHFDDAKAATDAPNLYRYILARRHFLTTGRGGMGLSALVVAFGLLVQVVLMTWFVYLFAWPLGRFTALWAVMGDEVGTTVDLSWRLTGPAIVWALVGLGLFAFRTPPWRFSFRTSERFYVEVGAGLFIALAISLVGLLVLAPVVVWLFTELGVTGMAVAVFTAAGTAIGALVVPLVVDQLKPRLAYLGGVLLAAAVLLGGAIAMRESAIADGALRSGFVSSPLYLILLALFIVAWSRIDPHFWSLHTLYHHRLRGGFAVTTEEDKAPSRHPWRGSDVPFYPVAHKNEPLVSDYADAWGPEPLICASVAREARTATGIPALSYVISPKTVVVYDVPEDSVRADGSLEVRVHEVDTATYLDGIKSKRRRQKFGTITTAMTISGAAVAPAMGKHNRGSTNALFAALNVRLGAWMPNPRYTAVDTRYKTTRLNYLLKEVFGWYDLDDPYLYATDGGHRENLGLVELLRRRCWLIFCVDASGDASGEFTTLLEAIRLAEVECDVTVDQERLNEGLQRMRQGPSGEWPETCAIEVPIVYTERGEQPSATLIYMKAIVDREAETRLKAFKLEDPDFPNFSTGNQFLAENQFRNLTRLGRHMITKGLELVDQFDLETAVLLSTGAADEVDIDPFTDQAARLVRRLDPAVIGNAPNAKEQVAGLAPVVARVNLRLAVATALASDDRLEGVLRDLPNRLTTLCEADTAMVRAKAAGDEGLVLLEAEAAGAYDLAVTSLAELGVRVPVSQP